MARRPARRSSGPIPTLAGRRVLVVDDVRRVCQAVSRMLRRVGCEPVSAESAREAIEILEKSEPFDAILTDYHMTGETGVWLLRETRDRWPATIRILSSGMEVPHLDEHVSRGVVEHVLQKPVDFNALVGILVAGPSLASRQRSG